MESLLFVSLDISMTVTYTAIACMFQELPKASSLPKPASVSSLPPPPKKTASFSRGARLLEMSKKAKEGSNSPSVGSNSGGANGCNNSPATPLMSPR